MSIKDVRDYHLRMMADYIDLKTTLERLESEITPETSEQALKNIADIKQRVNKVQENYNRINYIMYLLDKPARKKKQEKWSKQNTKRLENIPEKDRLEFVKNENKTNLDNLKQYIKC